MERVALFADAEDVSAVALRLPRVPRITPAARSGESVNEQIASIERARIEEALRAEAWNISRAAARLGLPRNTLRYRMERHGLLEGDPASHRRVEMPLARPDEPLRRAPEPSMSVRWHRMRITLLEARVLEQEGIADHERACVLEQVAAKASAFGGRIIDVGPSSVKA